MGVSVPPLVEASLVVHVAEPAVVDAVAPGPVDALLPYTTVDVALPARVMPDTVIVCALTETLPLLVVV